MSNPRGDAGDPPFGTASSTWACLWKRHRTPAVPPLVVGASVAEPLGEAQVRRPVGLSSNGTSHD